MLHPTEEDREMHVRISLKTISTMAVLLLLMTACDSLNPGEDVGFQTTAIVPNDLLFAGHSGQSENTTLELRVINVQGTNSVLVAGSGVHDYSSPDLARRSNGTYFVGFGRTKLKVLDAFRIKVRKVEGFGAQQRSINFDRTDDSFTGGDFTYMDGDFDSGFDIVIQNGIEGSPTALTTDASGSFSYWTPAYSPDGNWILYAKVPVGATSGAGCELWRIHPDGTGAEQLPITTTEVPTYATWSPNGAEIFVPGDFTSYRVADGTVGKFDHARDLDSIPDKLETWGYEMVGSPLTGPTHEGDTVSSMRHTFPLSAIWVPGDKLYLAGLVAYSDGAAPHAVAGIGIFAWLRDAQVLLKHLNPTPVSEIDSEGYSLSIIHPTIIP